MQTGRVDHLAVATATLAVVAAVLAVATAALYLQVMRDEPEPPVLWYVALLLVAAVAALAGASRRLPHRQAALTSAAVLLLVAGVLGIFSVGLPAFVAGLLCVCASFTEVRRGQVRPGSPTTR